MTALSRSLGVWQGVAFNLGAIVGAGILVLPGITVAIAGPAAIASWALVAAATVPVALTFALLAGRYPDAGGVATFARRAFNDRSGTAVGWLYLVASIVGHVIMALTAAYYLGEALRLDTRSAPYLAAALLFGTGTVSTRGVVASGRVQLALGLATCAVLATAVIAATSRIDAHLFVPFAPNGPVAIGQAALLAYVAFFGWEAVMQLSGEFRDPRRDILRAALISLVTITVLYLGLVVAVVGLGLVGGPGGARVAVARLFELVAGPTAGHLVALVGVVIVVGTLNTYVAATSRLAYALGRDGGLPRQLGQLSGATPRVAVLAVVGASFVVLSITSVAGGTVEALLPIPAALGLVTTIVGMSPGLVLLTGRGRWLAGAGLAASAAVLPFGGIGILIPAGVVGLAWLTGRGSATRAASLPACCSEPARLCCAPLATG